uniref:LIM zinc-binding domain-containing protein n=1 Tax=Cyanistes caeruleus TaxID=156563 RepID=A0A8C0VDR0_CYACU
MSDALANAVCERCQTRFDPAERIVNSNGELYHENCFVCAQCFRQFPEGLFYEVSSLTGWKRREIAVVKCKEFSTFLCI